MGLTTAVLQLLVIGLIAGGGTFFMRYHVATLRRPDFSSSAFFEDSKAGNGTRYRVLTSSADTGGASCTLEVLTRATAPAYLAAFPGSGPEHSHGVSAERVVVRSGKLGWRRQRGREHDEGVVTAGDAPLEFPAGTSHMLFNADNSTDVLYELTHEPAGPAGEAFFENLAALGWAYGSVDRIHPLQIVVLFDAAGAQLADVSGVMAPIVHHAVLPLARFVGFRATYEGHRSKHGSSAPAEEPQTSDAGGSESGSRDEL